MNEVSNLLTAPSSFSIRILLAEFGLKASLLTNFELRFEPTTLFLKVESILIMSLFFFNLDQIT